MDELSVRDSIECMSERVRFRPAVESDSAALMVMINRAFVVEDFIEGPRTDARRLAETMAKGEILLAEDEAGRPVASVYMERRGARAYMGMLAVTPERQGTGLGRRLLDEAEARLRAEGVEVIDITVLSLRPELLPIYRRMGFRETGTQPFDAKQVLKAGYECHCIAMTKVLKGREEG